MLGLPSAALAQATTDQPDPNAPAPPPPAPADATTPGEPNAQQPAATPTDSGAIVVTGFRGSLQNSINIKRRERGTVEAVSAEEIGKLPDVSIAESIARLPGITAQRVKGRAEIVSIRGFSPDFTTVLLNGRQQASSGFNRAVEFDQYPSELMASVVVYKTPDASISGMGLAGTVDLRTIRPLEFGKRAVAMNLRGQWDQGGGRNKDFSKYGWRGSASYIDQNEDGTLGWMVSYAHLDSPSHVNHTKNWFYSDLGDGIQVLQGDEIRASNSRDIRDGVTGAIEWKPSDAVHSILDLYYSRFKQKTLTTGEEGSTTPFNGDPVTFNVSETQDKGGLTFSVADHVNNVVPILRWNAVNRTDHLFSAGLNNDFRLAERTHLLADLSYSSNKRVDKDTEIFGGYGVGPHLASVFDSFDRLIPLDGFNTLSNGQFDYADASKVSLGDRGGWGGYGSEGHIKTPHIRERLASGDATIRQDFEASPLGNFISSVEAGVDYTHRHKDKTVTELDLFLKNNRQQVLVDPQFLNDPTSLGFAGDLSILGIDVDKLVGSGNYYDVVQLEDANHFDKAWDIKEGITTFKAKANIDSGELHGNVGVQVVRQKQTSSGLRIFAPSDGSAIQLQDVSAGASYTDILPSLNLYYDLNRQNRVRFALAKVMARPRMDDMRANLVPGFNGGICQNVQPPCVAGQEVHPWSAGGGNPQLEPWRAKELDVGYEWYGGKASYFSVHGFYMWLDNYIYNQALTADFSGFTPPATELAKIPPGVIVSPIGEIDVPANGQGGWIGGVEVSGAFEFGRLSRVLDGFGATGSVSYTDYKLKKEAQDSLPDRILPGFSKWVYDATGYYEKNGVQARLSYRHRSTFKGEVVSLFTNLGFPFIGADDQMDGQIGYTFQPGSRFNGLGIVLQVSNILNSPYREFSPTGGVQTLNVYEEYGRSWLLGASYHF
ncbi:TonB-dependent receptor [Sphingomonas sp. URHD0057]|uniref:TonB-dependent receptor n=1 Tax=Sphingomonas sp. URHD0057 TaxID=1380389 RepID=UPI000B192888|nr:TonB-dependent receptor [Sphingomonas sp. URHD0057]